MLSRMAAVAFVLAFAVAGTAKAAPTQEEKCDAGELKGVCKAAACELKIELKYHEGEPAIREISRVSKPGRRVYSKLEDIPRVYNGLGVAILSTPRGVISDSEARDAHVGGEVLCKVL